MESYGVRDKIQISKSTADILIAGGKGHWVKPREEEVKAKGKGSLQTFWLNPGAKKNDTGTTTTSSETGSSSDGVVSAKSDTSEKDRNFSKQERLVDWMVDLLSEHIKKMVS